MHESIVEEMILETLQPSIAVGDRVILNHLQTRSDLNGQQGIVMKQKNDTYVVHIDPTSEKGNTKSEKIKIKSKNISLYNKTNTQPNNTNNNNTNHVECSSLPFLSLRHVQTHAIATSLTWMYTNSTFLIVGEDDGEIIKIYQWNATTHLMVSIANVVVIIVKITFISSFFFYRLPFNHSFPTNSNSMY